MKLWITTALVSGLGFSLGWLGVYFGLAQSWWPLPISGQPETVVSGALLTNSSGYPTGLLIQNADEEQTFVDLSRLPVGTATNYLNRQVIARGETLILDSDNYLQISWLK